MTNKYPQPKKCPRCGNRLRPDGNGYRCTYMKCLYDEFNTELKPDKSKEK